MWRLAFVLALFAACAVLLYGSMRGGQSLRVGVVQLEASEAGDFANMEAYALEAKSQGADLVVFPESSTFGWLNPAVFTQAESIPGPQSDRYTAIARNVGVWLAVGLAERGDRADTDGDVYHAYDSAILINPAGEIVLHHRKHNVLGNAFNNDACRSLFGVSECSYSAGSLSEIGAAETPFGRVALLVCADAYRFKGSALNAVKLLKPDIVIVPWGVAAGSQEECGGNGFNATQSAAAAAQYLGTAYVIGANPIGERPYGRFLPSWYCGESGYARPDGSIGGDADMAHGVTLFDIPLER